MKKRIKDELKEENEEKKIKIKKKKIYKKIKHLLIFLQIKKRNYLVFHQKIN